MAGATRGSILSASALFLISFLCSLSSAVDRGNFKTCRDARFCRKHRELKNGDFLHELLLDTASLATGGSSLSATVRNTNTKDELLFELFAIKDRTLRMKLNEKSPIRKRYEVEMSLDGEPEYVPLNLERKDGALIVSLPDKIQVTLTANPFRVDIYDDGTLLSTLNAQNLMLIEPMKVKPGYLPADGDEPEPKTDGEEENPGAENEAAAENKENKKEEEEPWEESFKSHHDSKPFGHNSIGLDVAFVGFDNVYGVPEHADSLRLSSTKDEEPYRLYNLDVFEYELNSRMALYGAIPFVIAHNEKNTLGMFWNNAAETWIDVDYTSASSGSSFFGGSSGPSRADTHWFSESGIIDVFIVLGPRPADVSRQFTALVGRPFLPPFPTIGYHQSRWNYNDEKDVATVHENFDEHDIPMDVIWLDIEYTDGKRYFTWDSPKFSNPAEMVANLTRKGRNMIVISDPHIKKDDNYFLHKKMRDSGFYVKSKDGKDYEGWCWPGAAYYPDFFNPDVRDYYASLYAMDVFKDMWTWNDMNEPSVFNGPEVTMYKDNLHHGEIEHREVHNLYGMAHLLGTFDGHMRRNDNVRPFILTRSFFAGTQRIAAAWTGDNAADWGHLKASNPMLLSLGISGMTFVGADIGGFFKNPDSQLLVRWYQAAAFQPFFRAHAHIDTRRREPWLFDEQSKFLIRDAIRARYTFLPFWYTLFFQANQTGLPMMRPLWYEFPSDAATFAMDDEFLLGNALLVKPVTEENQKTSRVYLPGDGKEKWHDITTLQIYPGGSTVDIETPINKIPVFQRGGSIIPRRFRVRRSAILGIEDPITLSIALNDKDYAIGNLYLDDGLSRSHRDGDYLYTQQELKNNVLESKVLHAASKYQTKVWLERVYITGFKFKPSSVEVNELESKARRSLDFHFDDKHRILTIRKPGVSMGRNWAIVIRP